LLAKETGNSQTDPLRAPESSDATFECFYFDSCFKIRRLSRNSSIYDMPRYYFNIYNDDITLDYEGAMLADEHAARAYAVVAVRALAAETTQHGHLVRHHRVEYVDAAQNALGEVRFDEAVEISP
jgi:hypothetical protein